MESPHSLYILNERPRLIATRYPILATVERFSSASRAVQDSYTKRNYWITPVSEIREGEHTVGKWRFGVRNGGVSWAKEAKDDGDTNSR